MQAINIYSKCATSSALKIKYLRGAEFAIANQLLSIFKGHGFTAQEAMLSRVKSESTPRLYSDMTLRRVLRALAQREMLIRELDTRRNLSGYLVMGKQLKTILDLAAMVNYCIDLNSISTAIDPIVFLGANAQHGFTAGEITDSLSRHTPEISNQDVNRFIRLANAKFTLIKTLRNERTDKATYTLSSEGLHICSCIRAIDKLIT